MCGGGSLSPGKQREEGLLSRDRTGRGLGKLKLHPCVQKTQAEESFGLCEEMTNTSPLCPGGSKLEYHLRETRVKIWPGMLAIPVTFRHYGKHQGQKQFGEDQAYTAQSQPISGCRSQSGNSRQASGGRN